MMASEHALSQTPGRGQASRHPAAVWVAWVQRHALLTAALIGLLTALLGWYAASHLRIDNDTAAMLDPDLSFLQTYEAYQDAFPQFEDTLVIVLDGAPPREVDAAADALTGALRERVDLFLGVYDPRSEPFFRRHALLYLPTDQLASLSDRLTRAQPVIDRLALDPTLGGVLSLLGDAAERGSAGPDAELDRLWEAAAASADAAVRGGGAPVDWDALLQGEVVGRFGSADTPRVIVAQPRMDFAQAIPGRDAMTAVRAHAERLTDRAPSLRVRMTGPVAIRAEEIVSVRDSGLKVLALASVMVVGLLALAVRSSWLLLASLLTLGVGLIWTAAFAALTVGRLNMLSVAFGALYVGLGADYLVHLCLPYRRWRASLPPRRAMLEQVRYVARPMVLCALTTALAFYAFQVTPLQGVAQLGLIGGTGVLICLGMSLTLLPALVELLPTIPGRPAAPKVSPPITLPRRPRWAVGGALGLAAAAVALLPTVGFDYDPLHLRDPDSTSIRTLQDLAETDPTHANPAIVLAQPASVPDLARRVRALAPVRDVMTVHDLVPEDQDAKLAILDTLNLVLGPSLWAADPAAVAAEDDPLARADPAMRRLHAALAGAAPESAQGDLRAALGELLALPEPQRRAAVAAWARDLAGDLPTLFTELGDRLSVGAVTPASLPEPIRRRWIAPDGRHRMEVYPAHDVTQPQPLRRFVAAVQSVAPGATGTPALYLGAGDAVIRGLAVTGTLSLAVVATILLASYRSVRPVLICLTPVVLTGLLTAATAGVLGIRIQFANVIALPLLFGLTVDASIHMLRRARDAGARSGQAQRHDTKMAVLLSSLTTLCGFGNLIAASHPGMASLGQLLVVGLFWMLVTTLWLLPALAPLAGPGVNAPAGWSWAWSHGRAGWFAAVLGLALLITLLIRQGIGDVIQMIGSMHWGLALVIGLHALPLGLDGLAWRSLLPARRRPTAGALIAYRWIGESVNTLLPVAHIGGEWVKARLLRRAGVARDRAAASVVVAMTLTIATQLLFVTAAALLVAARGLDPGTPLYTALGAALLGLALAGFYAAQRAGLFGRGARLFRRLRRPRGPDRPTRGADRLDARVRRLYRDRRAIGVSAALHLAAWVTGAAEMAVALYFLGHPVSWTDALLLEGLTIGVRMAGFVVPGALGVQEGGLILVGSLFGLSPQTALALSLVRRVRDLVLGVPALAALQAMIWRHESAPARGGAPVDSDPQRDPALGVVRTGGTG